MNSLLILLKRPLLHVAGFSFFVNLLLLAPAIFMLQVFDRVLASQSGETLLVLLLGVAIALALLLALDYLRGRLQGVAGNLVAEALSPTRGAHHGGAGRAAQRPARQSKGCATWRRCAPCSRRRDCWRCSMRPGCWSTWRSSGWRIRRSAWPRRCAALLMLALALVNDLAHPARYRGAAEGRGRRDALPRSLAAQRRGGADARHDRCAARALAARRTPRSLRCSAPPRARRWHGRLHAHGAPGGAGAACWPLGAWLVISGEATAGMMIATTILLGRALAPVEQVVGSWRVLAEGRAAFRRLVELLEAAAAEPRAHGVAAAERAAAARRSWCSARRRGERLILAGVSLQLEPGEALAVIGPSGAGKSTLVRLLTGVWKPSAGTVRLDQADLAQWPREEIGPRIGYVPQDVELFPGTVAENIARLGAVDPAQGGAGGAARRVHEMILSLPEGYDTPIDPASALLSPGQRQRIALARALYGDPKLVILDEPNSNLDGAGENALAATLRDLRGKVTIVVVTHRNTLMQHMDKMLVLDGGRTRYGPLSVMRAMQHRSGCCSSPPGRRRSRRHRSGGSGCRRRTGGRHDADDPSPGGG